LLVTIVVLIRSEYYNHVFRLYLTIMLALMNHFDSSTTHLCLFAFLLFTALGTIICEIFPFTIKITILLMSVNLSLLSIGLFHDPNYAWQLLEN